LQQEQSFNQLISAALISLHVRLKNMAKQVFAFYPLREGKITWYQDITYLKENLLV
jgi:hypothetical protein